MIAGRAPRSPEARPDPFADDGETMRDIRTCEVLHEAKAAFQDALVEDSAVRDHHFVGQLRQEPVYQIAEFFFLLRAFRLDSEEKIRRYAEFHNRHLEGLQADRTKMRRLGLSPTRVRKGMFSPDNIPKLVENYRAGVAAIDQSDLSRLLIEVMSPETCRKTTVVLTEAGYLERRRSPYQSVLVRSTGALERVFARCLRHVRTALADDDAVADSVGAAADPDSGGAVAGRDGAPPDRDGTAEDRGDAAPNRDGTAQDRGDAGAGVSR